jgi:hypothetical protein
MDSVVWIDSSTHRRRCTLKNKDLTPIRKQDKKKA